MVVTRFAEPGTVITFDVQVGPSHNSATITMEAKVVSKGIRVTPKKIVQITNMTAFNLHRWMDLINLLNGTSVERGLDLNDFVIPWNLYHKITAFPDVWLTESLARQGGYIHESYK